MSSILDAFVGKVLVIAISHRRVKDHYQQFSTVLLGSA